MISPICTVRQVMEEWYFTHKASRKVLKAKREHRTPIYVHTMGKVGSSTVRNSLRLSSMADSLAVYGTYFLSDEGLNQFHKIEEAGFGDWCNYTKPVKQLLCEGRVLSNEISHALQQGVRTKVISLVRDPISTNVSGFFQNYRWWPKNVRASCDSRESNCVDNLIRSFFENYPHDIPLTWWETEMKDFFHVDVMKSEFAKSSGYTIYASDVADVLVIKLEKLDSCAQDAFKEFMGIMDFQVRPRNTATDKWFSDIYREFCKTITFPESYLEKMYKSPLCSNFYSGEEIAKYTGKWRR